MRVQDGRAGHGQFRTCSSSSSVCCPQLLAAHLRALCGRSSSRCSLFYQVPEGSIFWVPSEALPCASPLTQASSSLVLPTPAPQSLLPSSPGSPVAPKTTSRSHQQAPTTT